MRVASTRFQKKSPPGVRCPKMPKMLFVQMTSLRNIVSVFMGPRRFLYNDDCDSGDGDEWSDGWPRCVLCYHEQPAGIHAPHCKYSVCAYTPLCIYTPNYIYSPLRHTDTHRWQYPPTLYIATLKTATQTHRHPQIVSVRYTNTQTLKTDTQTHRHPHTDTQTPTHIHIGQCPNGALPHRYTDTQTLKHRYTDTQTLTHRDTKTQTLTNKYTHTQTQSPKY